MKRLAIIGGGPAGYVAAIIAAQQGKEVYLITEDDLGGTCLNEGCIPTKALLESARIYDVVKHANEFGIRLLSQQIEIDWETVQNRKGGIISSLIQGIQYLMRKNQIKVMEGRASFVSSHRLQVKQASNIEEVEADHILIATGSEPIPLPFAPFNGDWIIHSGQALTLTNIPSSLLIIGGGVIGCEFASIYSRMGTKVTIIEMADQLLPGEDADISSVLHKELVNGGVTIETSASVQELSSEKKKAYILNKNKKLFELEAEQVLVSVGRRPRTTGLGLEKIGVNYTKQGISVNNHLQTSIDHIYACGDVIGGIQLAHVAFHEGKVAALHACGHDVSVDYKAVPRCVYTHPEIASVGLTEKEARKNYSNIRIGEFSFASNGKALIANEQTGKVKVIVDSQYQEIIGLSIVGSHATELIGQGAFMLHAEMTADQMDNMIFAHPSLSEAVHEALLNSNGQAVHA